MDFFEDMLTQIEQWRAIDRTKVFATGFSLGGFFSSVIGCDHPELVRAIAPHSGGGPSEVCVSSTLPVMILHGTNDNIVPVECVSTQSRERWAAHNGCSMTSDIVEVQNGTCEIHQGCREGGQTHFCSFTDAATGEGMGHGWAGADPEVDGMKNLAGGTQFESATKLAWDFFASTL